MHKVKTDLANWPYARDLFSERPGDQQIRLTPNLPDMGRRPELDAMLADGWSVTGRQALCHPDGTVGCAAQITLSREDEQALVIFSDMAQIPCFTAGTAIATRTGPVAVENLRPGDFVNTRDSGLQPVRWIGQRTIDADLLSARPHWAPILIRKDSLGPGRPHRDIRVSPNHRMLMNCMRLSCEAGQQDEVLVAARYLTCLPGITADPCAASCYVHVLFDRHEVIMADGCWSESFQPNSQSLLGLDRTDRRRLLALYPELAEQPSLPDYMSARPSLDRQEVAEVLHPKP